MKQIWKCTWELFYWKKYIFSKKLLYGVNTHLKHIVSVKNRSTEYWSLLMQWIIHFYNFCDVYACVKYFTASVYIFRFVSSCNNTIDTSLVIVLIKLLNISHNTRNIFIKDFYKCWNISMYHNTRYIKFFNHSISSLYIALLHDITVHFRLYSFTQMKTNESQ